MTKTIAFFTGLSIILLVGCQSANNKKDDECCSKETSDQIVLNTLTEEEAADGWKLLFDGETTAGWKGFKQDKFPDKGWHAVDGALMIEYSGTGEAGYAGDIITEEAYANFDLKIDWKISPGGNSGILLNVNESEKYSATWHTAHEIQVIDDFGYDAVHDYVMNVRQISGAYYDMYTPKRAAAKVQGEWNEARIRLEILILPPFCGRLELMLFVCSSFFHALQGKYTLKMSVFSLYYKKFQYTQKYFS